MMIAFTFSDAFDNASFIDDAWKVALFQFLCFGTVLVHFLLMLPRVSTFVLARTAASTVTLLTAVVVSVLDFALDVGSVELGFFGASIVILVVLSLDNVALRDCDVANTSASRGNAASGELRV